MSGAILKRSWRGTVGLIAAYALVLQAFLAYGMTSQVAATGDTLYSSAFFVICVSHDTDLALDDADVPVKPAAHCPVCTLSGSTGAVLPEPMSLHVQQAALVERTPFVSVAACMTFHNARAGLSRAPPRNV
jgi:hypothetical protein